MEVGLLAVTGVILYFVYRPSPSQGWIQMTGVDRPMGLPEWTRLLHHWIAILTVPTALVAGVLSSLRLVTRRRWQAPAAAAGLLVAALAGLATGFRLPWDQLALWAVTRGEIHVGYGSLLAGEVRFVITNRGEEAPTTVITLLVVHAVTGIVAGALVAVAWRLVRNPAHARREANGQAADSPAWGEPGWGGQA